MLIRPMLKEKLNNKTSDTVREWILNELFDIYNYPKEWINKRIIFINEKDFCGVKFLTENGYPFIIISIVDEYILGKSEESLNLFIEKYKYNSLYIITDGNVSGTKFIKYNFYKNRLEYIVDIEKYNKPKKTEIIQNYNLHIQSNTQELLSDNTENMFFEIHSYLRDIDGLHADEALDELCKVLYCKIFDEIHNESIPMLQRALYGTSDELAVSVRDFYQSITTDNNCIWNGNRIGIFKEEIKLSNTCIANVVEVLQNYNILNSNIDIKGRAFQKVLNPAIRAGMGQFFTPIEIIRLMVNVMNPQVNETVLDPFCGSGHFLLEAFHFIKSEKVKEMKSEELNNQLQNYMINNIYGIEKSDRMVRILTTDMLLHGNFEFNVECSDSLLEFNNYKNLKREMFDIILTNPPFGSLLGQESIMQLGDFILANNVKNIPLEILGIERCIQFLKPGGRLGIVLPDGILDGKKNKYVRDWLAKYAKVRVIISLPVETFSPFGANIKTSIIFVRKWYENEVRSSDYNVFLSRLDNIGYDSAGRKKDTDELVKLQEEIIDFIDNEGW